MNAHRSIRAQLGRAEELMAGLDGHVAELSRRGIDAAFIARMNDCHARAVAAHNAKLAHLARMMEWNAERDHCLSELNDLYSEARKMIKVELAPETWREFGITDQR
jgi:hypothetical protein